MQTSKRQPNGLSNQKIEQKPRRPEQTHRSNR
jgi:hypothetical protein